MKRHVVFVIIGVAAHLGWGQPIQPPATNNFGQRLGAAFDKSRLESIMLKYEVKSTCESTGEDQREVFLVMDGKKLFIRMQYLGPWEMIDQTVDPPVVTTNWSPNVSYQWETGEHVVNGQIDPDIPWEINPAGTRSPPEYLNEQVLKNVEIFFGQLTANSRRCRFRGERTSPGGRIYLFTNPTSGIVVEFTVSDADGDGLAPVRERDLKDGKVITDIMWSGWKNYNGIWVPQHCTSFTLDDAGGEALTEEFTLLRVEKVNEPIHPRWFMPQFPAGPLAIEDHTVSPPLEMDNIDLDGNPYTGMEEYEALQENEEEEGSELAPEQPAP